jgi:hypothetical protein
MVYEPAAGLLENRLVSQNGIILWIVALIILEVQHLKWIAWEYWDCRRHGVKNKDCRCKARLMFLL